MRILVDLAGWVGWSGGVGVGLAGWVRWGRSGSAPGGRGVGVWVCPGAGYSAPVLVFVPENGRFVGCWARCDVAVGSVAAVAAGPGCRRRYGAGMADEGGVPVASPHTVGISISLVYKY